MKSTGCEEPLKTWNTIADAGSVHQARCRARSRRGEVRGRHARCRLRVEVLVGSLSTRTPSGSRCACTPVAVNVIASAWMTLGPRSSES